MLKDRREWEKKWLQIQIYKNSRKTCKIENKYYVMVHPRNAYEVEFPDHLW